MAKKTDDDFSYLDPDLVDDENEDYDEEELDQDDDGYLDDSPEQYDEYGNPIEDEYDENGEPIEEDEEEEKDDLSSEDAQDIADEIERQAKGKTNDEILEQNSKTLGDTNINLQQLDIKDVKLDTKTTGKLAGKGAGKAGGKAIGAGLKALVTNPYFWLVVGIVLAVVLIIVLIVVLVNAMQAPFSNIDPENGVFDTANGIQGDKFYGARVVYYDDSQAHTDLQKYYTSLSSDFLFEIDKIEGIDFNTGLATYDSNQQNNETYTAGIEKKLATALIVEIIEVMDGLDVELSISFNETLTEEKKQLISASINNISHFGYTTNELIAINSALTNYINLNRTNIFTISSNYTADFATDIATIFTNNYSNLNVVAPKYYVKDVILRVANNMINGLTAENYIAFIYMPNSTVTINQAEYLFYLKDENATMDYSIRHQTETIENLYDSNTVDSTWFDGFNSKTADTRKTAITLSKFESLVDDNELLLEEERNIYSVLFNSSNYTDVDFTILNQLFKSSVVSEENGDSYTKIDYLPAQDNNYFYLTFNSNVEFNFCEFAVDYK